jgi:hypothetical protein
VDLNQMAGNGQPQSQPAVLPGAGAVSLSETVENEG